MVCKPFLRDVGIGTGLHQHTGSAVETREETYTVMQAVDTRYMKFAPDIGQAQKGGTDAAQLVKDFSGIIRMIDDSWRAPAGTQAPLPPVNTIDDE